uniref:EDRF1 TPR repeats region domain-containing protein n=1 Tax=Ciona savignyi TaxID=51511 RepID=H2ZLQ2_CIOSA
MTESTKRRHNKMLAGSHYDKAISHFKQLSHEMSIDYFRVLLEKLAMHENSIEANVTSNPSAKVKLILEALGLALPCVEPLNKLQDSLQEFIAHH